MIDYDNHCLIWPNNIFIDKFILQVVEFLGFSLFYRALCCFFFLKNGFFNVPIIFFSYIFFNNSSVQFVKAPVSFIVWSQYSTISFIKIASKSFGLVHQLSKIFQFWFSIMGSRSGFRPLGINSAWIQFNKKSLCDSYLTFVSFRRFSFRTNCFFLLSTNIGGLRKLFHSLICFFNQCRSWSLVDKDYWVFVFFSLTIWRWLMLCLLHSLSFFYHNNRKLQVHTNYKLHQIAYFN